MHLLLIQYLGRWQPCLIYLTLNLIFVHEFDALHTSFALVILPGANAGVGPINLSKTSRFALQK